MQRWMRDRCAGPGNISISEKAAKVTTSVTMFPNFGDIAYYLRPNTHLAPNAKRTKSTKGDRPF